MDWDDSPEQAAFRSTVATLISDHLPDYYRRKIAAMLPGERGEAGGVQGGGGLADDLHSSDPEARAAAESWGKALRDRGFIALAFPKEYGGGGHSPVEQFIFAQEMARAQAPSPGANALVASALIGYGTEKQRQEFLPGTLNGEFRWFQAFSEPGAGSDLGALTTRAVRDGDEWVINGQKLWGGSVYADYCFGLFRTDPDAPKHRGISFMIFDMRLPSGERRPGLNGRLIDTIHWHHGSISETFFEDVRVPGDSVIGEENRGWYVGMNVLDVERSGVGNAIGIQQQFQQLLDHLKTPQGKQQTEAGGLRRQRLALADRHIETEVAFNISYKINSLQSANLPTTYESSSGKIVTTETTQRLANTGMKTFGLYSLVWDARSPYAPLKALFTYEYLDSIKLTIWGGSNEIQRNIIATRALGLPRG